MPNTIESAARFETSQSTFFAAASAESRGDYATAAEAYEQVAAVYGEHGGVYLKAAKRCRRFLAKQVG